MTSTPTHPDHSPAAEAWSDADLELFHDGEMPPEPAARLARALRIDSTLRTRLARIADADRLVASALAGPASATPTRNRRPIAHLLLAAASLALVASAWILLKPQAPAPAGPITKAQDPAPPSDLLVQPIVPPAETAEPPLPLTVIASVRLPHGSAPHPDDLGLPCPESRPVSTLLASHLARGDADAATRLLQGLDETVRRDAIAAIALSLRSAITAEAVLDALPPAQQAEICSAWAAEPHLRPVAFRRLAQLKQLDELAARVGAIAQSLHADPELRPWVRSYLTLPRS